MISPMMGGTDRPTLAASFVTGPQPFAPAEAARRLADWLGDLDPAQASTLAGLCASFPQAKAILEGIAEASPYLFDLMRADGGRLIRLLQCEPDGHLAALIARTVADVAAAADETEVMTALRRMKSEAALLIALADIGGVWPVMRVTRGAHRHRGDLRAMRDPVPAQAGGRARTPAAARR